MQLRCDNHFKQIEENRLPAGGKELFEQDIVELFLTLLNEGKYLKERISQVTNAPCDLSQIENYGKFNISSLFLSFFPNKHLLITFFIAVLDTGLIYQCFRNKHQAEI